MDLTAFGRTLVVIALVLLLLGALIFGLGKLTGGRGLPGDIVIDRGNVKIIFPIVSGIIISILLTLLINVILWVVNRGR